MTARIPLFAVGALPLILAQGGDRPRITLGNILVYILIGAVIGVIARLLVPGTGGFGFLATIVVGILGAVIAGWLAAVLFGGAEGVPWIASILVAALLVWLVTRYGGGRWGAGRRTL